MSTRWKALIGTELPIIQAPMAGVQGAELVVAVSNAGGLGSLPCAMLTIQGIRRELTVIASKTAKPFNVNFFCHAPPPRDSAREERWRQRFEPYYHELTLTDIPQIAPGRTPFNDEAATLLEEFRPPVISFHFGLPAEPLLARVRATGARILSSATTVDEARWLEARGVDAVIAQGIEAGGHRGMFLTGDLHTQVPTIDLVRQITSAVDVPVIAAGGIADAAGVSDAMAAGAIAVQVGTAYLLCPEATTTAVHRAALKSASPPTVVTNVFTGRPARGLVNRLVREMGPMNDDVPAFPLAASVVGPLRAAAEQRGIGDFTPMWAGTRAGSCREIPAAQLTGELAALVSATDQPR